MFCVLHGRDELGYVDELTFLQKRDGPKVLLLGGRAWQVNHVDWQRRTAYVEATEARGRSRWKGAGRGLSYRVCQAIRRILASSDSRDCWSQRARAHMEEIRAEFAWLDAYNTVVLAGFDGETASLGRYPAAEEAELMAKYGIEDVAIDDLPRGVIIGTVELYDCDGGDWSVRKPERAKTPRRPTRKPQPIWFNPF